MKTQQEYLKEYALLFLERNPTLHPYCNGTGSLSDNCFCSSCLESYFKLNPKLFRAMVYFDMTPKYLLEILESIGGGDLVYEFSDIKILRAMYLIYPFTMESENPYEWTMDIHIFDEILASLFPHEELSLLPKKDMRQYHQADGTFAISLDRAIGYIIHAEQYIWLHSQLEWGPTGDDSYFDYYPGNIDYFNALNDWFLKSNIRMT